MNVNKKLGCPFSDGKFVDDQIVSTCFMIIPRIEALNYFHFDFFRSHWKNFPCHFLHRLRCNNVHSKKRGNRKKRAFQGDFHKEYFDDNRSRREIQRSEFLLFNIRIERRSRAIVDLRIARLILLRKRGWGNSNAT